MSSEQNRAAKQVTETLSYFLSCLSAYSTTAANKVSLISNRLHRFTPPVSYFFPDKLYQKHPATPKRSRWI